MSALVIIVTALLQAGLTGVMYYLRGRSHNQWLQDDFVTLYVPATVGFGLFLRGFARLWSAGSKDYRNPMAFGASFVASLLVMVITIMACMRYLGS